MSFLFRYSSTPLFISWPLSAQDKAVLKRDSDTKYHVDVVLDAASSPGGQVVAALYYVDADGKRIQIQKFPGPLPPQNGPQKTVFSLDMPKVPSDDDSFVVSVFELPTPSGTLSYDLPVTRLLTRKLSSKASQCPHGIQLRLESADYTLQNWRDIDMWIRKYSRNPEDLAAIEIISGTNKSLFPLRSARVLTLPDQAFKRSIMLVCLEPRSQLPDKSFNVTIKFNDAPTYDLQQPINETGLGGVPTPPTPSLADDNGLPGQRGMERNLDLGVTFASSVEEVQKDDRKVVERKSRGVFDLRLAPLLDVEPRKRFDRNQKWYRYYTPGYIDAAVSNGKIDKDTLSMNRIIFGTEYEWRYYAFQKDPQTGNTITTPYQTFHRLMLRASHASDRDFKQKEYLATFEYQPVLGLLNHPIYLNWRFEDDRRVEGHFGYEVKPRFGFSLGRTYARYKPAAAIEPSPTARRFHTGLDINLNLTRYVTLSLSDIFFLRGEASDNRFHNHFKSVIEAPLGRPFANSVHSLFFSFERGNEPPFATRDVNALKVGYRIRSEGWLDRFR